MLRLYVAVEGWKMKKDLQKLIRELESEQTLIATSYVLKRLGKILKEHDLRIPNRKGDKNPSSVLTSKEVTKIKKSLKSGVSVRILAESYEVGQTCIRKIKKGQTWGHILV